MPVKKCSNGKFRIGSGPCMYKTKASAERAFAAYKAKEHSLEEVKEMILEQKKDLEQIRKKLQEKKNSYEKYIEECGDLIEDKVKEDDDEK